MTDTLRLNASESYESYCAALGLSVSAVRRATVTEAMCHYIARLDAALDAALAELEENDSER